MGLLSRLNGKSAPLPSNETETCPECGRKSPNYKVVKKGDHSVRECPFCEHEFEVKSENPQPKNPK